MAPVDPAFSAKARNISAVAAVAVVIIHAGSGGMGSFAAKVLHQALGWGICTFAVPWFFFASGYFFAGHLDEKGWWLRALRQRAKTLLLPYLLWNAAFAIFIVALGMFDNLGVGNPAFAGIRFRGIMWRSLGVDFATHPLLVPFWYIRCLLIIVALSPALVWALRRWRWYVPLAILPFYLYCCGIQDCHAMPWFFFYSPFSLAGWLYFSIGVLARIEYRRVWDCRIPTKWLLTVTLSVVALGRSAIYWRMPSTAGCMWLIGIPLLLLCVWRLVPAHPFPAWLLSLTFPVYALHFFFEHFLETLVFPVAHPSCWAYIFRCAASLLLAVSSGLLIRTYLPRESRILFGGR